MDRKKILIVDDDESLVRILSVNLSLEGYEVFAAFDGTSAVMSAHRVKPDLIILDVRMPAGDGFSVVERLKMSTKTFNIPIIILSALPKEDIEERALRAGVVHCIAKPFDNGALLEYVRDLIGAGEKRSVVNA
ncbi:MAG: response regulator [Actinobacteria bacterium]|nr:response regulator [Actinomycetota bacterium]